MWKIGCAALGLASVITAPSLAQSPQQTVEGAQRFLSMTLPDLGYEGAAYINGVNEMRRNPAARNLQVVGNPVIIDAATVSHCRSKIISSADNVIMRIRFSHGTVAAGNVPNGSDRRLSLG